VPADDADGAANAADTARGDRASADSTRTIASVQTPQAFRAVPLLDAFRRGHRDGFRGTDTSSCVEKYADLAIVGVAGSAENVKITFSDDLAVAELLLALRRDGAAPAPGGPPRR
jgi:2-C-methyl-D-erythritol 4-phosphate cytidylyltransferase